MSERLQQPLPTSSAVRISEALKWATPENTFLRWFGPHIRALGPTITHDQSSTPITSDYRARNLLPNWPVETAGYGLKIRGANKIATKPIDVETFFQTHAPEGENIQSLEGQFLHRIIAHGEAHRRDLPEKNKKHIEQLIYNAYFGNAQTVAEQGGQISIYTPFVPSLVDKDHSHVGFAHTKMVQIVVDKTPLTAKEVFDTRQILRNSRVIAALNDITYHAVTVKRIDENTIQITNPKEQPYIVDLSIRERREEAPVEPIEKAEGGFDKEIAKAYAESRHGVDGILMDPDIARVLETYAPDKTIADIGMGAGPVAIDAIKAGAAKVYGLDNSQAMLDQANEAITKAEHEKTIASGSIQTILDSTENLPNPPYQDSSADLVLSVNVGCALPSEGIFAPHFSEMARIVTPDGKIFVTAPTTFGEVFTAGKLPKDKILEKIGLTLIEINRDTFGQDEAAKIRKLREKMGELAEVNRATFVLRDVVDQDGADKKFVLVYDGRVPQVLKDITIRESALKRGEPIERKLAGGVNTTGLVVPNFYHPREEYLDAISASGLTIVGGEPIHHVMTQKELNEYNASLPPERQLGQEYFANSPFDIYLLTK